MSFSEKLNTSGSYGIFSLEILKLRFLSIFDMIGYLFYFKNKQNNLEDIILISPKQIIIFFPMIQMNLRRFHKVMFKMFLIGFQK